MPITRKAFHIRHLNVQIRNGKTGHYSTAPILHKTQPVCKQTNYDYTDDVHASGLIKGIYLKLRFDKASANLVVEMNVVQ